MKLLSSNSKLAKGGLNYRVTGLSLAPHNRGPMNVCPEAGFCSAVCNLWFAGRTVTRPVRNAMMKRSQWFADDRDGFEQQLRAEITSFACAAKLNGETPLIRLNVSSDLDWRPLIADFPNCTFYDYTKVTSRLWDTPANYYLTYSWSERSKPRDVVRYLKQGGNVAVCFDTEYLPSHDRIGELPSYWQVGREFYPVIDGDKHDYRLPEIDGCGVIVGLRFKGSRKLINESVRRGFTQSELVTVGG